MATVTSEHIKTYLLLSKQSLVVRSSASATSSAIRNIGGGYSVGTPTGKIRIISGLDVWIEVMQPPYNNGFVKSCDVKIFNEKKQEVFLLLTQLSPTMYNVAFSTTPNISERQAKSELDQFILNEQAVFASLGRSQALLKKIPATANVSTQRNSINTLTQRYNNRQRRITSLKGVNVSVANYKSIHAIPVSPAPRPQLYGFGAIPVMLIVPIVKWAIVGITVLSVWLVVRNNKSEGLSDLKLSKETERILSQKLSEEERKKVTDEFEQQRKQAFAEGKETSGGVIGKITRFLMWGAIGAGMAIVVKKAFFNPSK